MKLRTKAEADINITALIDCLMQCIIFFMVIMSVQYVFGVAIKFPAGGSAAKKTTEEKKEKYINVYIQSDQIEEGHALVKDGVLKLNGEEIPLTTTTLPPGLTDKDEYVKIIGMWEQERTKAYDYLKSKMQGLLDEGYKKDMIMVQGEMKTYHHKTMRVIDLGKEIGIDGFSLVPPSK